MEQLLYHDVDHAQLTREWEAMAALSASGGDDPLLVRVTIHEKATILSAAGELDLFTVQRFRERVEEALDASPAALIVDLTPASYIDSSGLAILMRAAGRLPGRVAVVTPRDRLARVFRATGVLDKLGWYRTLPEALDALHVACSP